MQVKSYWRALLYENQWAIWYKTMYCIKSYVVCRFIYILDRGQKAFFDLTEKKEQHFDVKLL